MTGDSLFLESYPGRRERPNPRSAEARSPPLYAAIGGLGRVAAREFSHAFHEKSSRAPLFSHGGSACRPETRDPFPTITGEAMRLTLRTLLAWKDNLLSPHDQLALGEKVAASQAAPRLVERMRVATSHPRLDTPPLDGHGVADDPNTVADYLDNVLAADRMEAFERACIESDVSLAEVASCHAILADLTRGGAEPARLDAAGCRRLLAAVTTKAAVLGVDVAAAAASESPPRPQGATSTREHGDRDEPAGNPPAAAQPRAARGREPSRRRQRWFAWLAASLAVLVLAGLGGALVWSLAPRGGRREIARQPRPSSPEQAPAPVVVPPPRPDPVPVPEVEQPAVPREQAAVEQFAAATPALEPPPAAAVDAVAAPVEPVRPETAPPVTPSVVPQQPAGGNAGAGGAAVQAPAPQADALVIVARVPDQPPSRPAEPAVVAEAPAAAPPPAAMERQQQPVADVNTPRQPLLRRAGGDPPAAWQAMDREERPEAGDELLAPPWCRPQFTFGDVAFRLEPNTRVVLSQDTQGGPRLEVVFGRVVGWREAGDAVFGVTAGGLVGVVKAGARRPVGVEVALDREPGSDPATRESRRRAFVVTDAGEAAWEQTAADGGPADAALAGIGPATMLAARTAVRWTSDEPAVAAVGVPPEPATWLRGAAVERTQRAAIDALAVRLAAGAPLEQSLVALADDPRIRAEHRMIAAATLALLGEYEPLVAQLADESPPGMLYEGQWKMLETTTVPLALARGANAAGRLAQAFQERVAGQEAELLVELVRGMAAEDFAAGGAAKLIDALEAERLVVRRYAYKCLCDVVQPSASDRLRYRADARPDARREGAKWWRAQMERGRLGPPR